MITGYRQHEDRPTKVGGSLFFPPPAEKPRTFFGRNYSEIIYNYREAFLVFPPCAAAKLEKGEPSE